MSARDDVITGKWQRDPDPRRHAPLLEEFLDRFAAEVRADALRNAADRIERRAAQLGGVWLQTDQVCAVLRTLAEPEGSAS
ncbi:hypothetical protein [Streptomyces sp. NPDC088674]|uniref:hypothetical protein n=1 Tax=Streptomyces sp. NPDC088674 TaxID=3365869 RepID=UPI0037FD3D44